MKDFANLGSTWSIWPRNYSGAFLRTVADEIVRAYGLRAFLEKYWCAVHLACDVWLDFNFGLLQPYAFADILHPDKKRLIELGKFYFLAERNSKKFVVFWGNMTRGFSL